MGPAAAVSRPILLAADSVIQHRTATHRAAITVPTAITLKDDKLEPIRPDDAVHPAPINSTGDTDSQSPTHPDASVVGSETVAIHAVE